jgi:hypothetical protein
VYFETDMRDSIVEIFSAYGKEALEYNVFLQNPKQ